MDGLIRDRVNILKLLMKGCISVLCGIVGKFFPVFWQRPRFGEIDIPCHGLNIEAGAPAEDRLFSSGEDVRYSGFGFMGRSNDIELLRRVGDIDQVVGNSHHLFFCDFG